MFNNLAAGDVISICGMKSEFLVLKTRGEGGEWKHLGQICDCGNHVHGISRLFRWSDEKRMPVDKDGNILNIWHSPQVTKEVSVPLAKKFEGLAVDDDLPGNEEIDRFFNENPDFCKAVGLGLYSHAGLGVTVVAMIRALGGALSNEQAALVAVAAEIHAQVSSPSAHMSSMSMLLGALSDTKR
jgi:hypothetical protein